MDSDGYLSQLADIFNGITVNTPSISAIIAIVLAGVLLLASGFASASEIAFFSLSPSDKNDIDERKHPADEKISFLLDDSERLLATILITNNFVNVTIIMLCNFFFMNVFVFHSPLAEFLILTVILTFLLLLFGEIMPKIYSAQKTLAFCRFSAPGIYALEKVEERHETSKELDMEQPQQKPKKQYIPPMNHPWRRAAFRKFVRQQPHHPEDPTAA